MSARLDRLAKVKQTGPGQWIAQCPAHDDSSPSLAIRELDDREIDEDDWDRLSLAVRRIGEAQSHAT